MAKSEKISLKLLVDEKKNKVVLAEAGQDFVDVLFGLLTFPMGTIARLLEKHQKLPQILGCYKNLSRSVSDMAVDDFKTEACKSMLLSPKSSMEIHCRRLKLHIDDTQATMFYVCSKKHESDSSKYSNFYKSRCSCGSLMIYQIHVPEDEQVVDSLGNAEDVVFVSCRSSFILTDDLKVMLNSIDEIVKVLNGLGYPNINDLKEMLIDVGSEEVLWFSLFVIFSVFYIGFHIYIYIKSFLNLGFVSTGEFIHFRVCLDKHIPHETVYDDDAYTVTSTNVQNWTGRTGQWMPY